jgi:ring-1,2-phenylacetyl-CoA epoxidase subunit PaaE
MSAATTFHALRLHQVQREAEDALVLGFELPSALEALFRFEPGQHLTLRAVVNGQELRRSYSICAAPGEPLRVGVREVAGGAFTGWLSAHAQPGLWLDVMPPSGRFGAALATGPRHVLAVAGGSGITPLLSIVKAALAADARTRCTLLYGNRSAATTMFREELEDLKNRHLSRLALHAVFSREEVDSPLHSGRLDAAKIAMLLRVCAPVDQAFVCGPHAMNDEVEAALLAAGLPAPTVHVERFGVPPALAAMPAPSARPGDAATARVRIVRDGLAREVAFGGGDTSILAAATRAGMALPFSCTSGVCATCRARVLEGEVRMDRNFALEAAELAAGFVLACQAHPVSERVVLSFDER